MFTNIWLQTTAGIIGLGAFDRVGRVTRETYESINGTGSSPFPDCPLLAMGYFPHYARIRLGPGGVLPAQARGEPWREMQGDLLFGVPHEAAYQSFLQLLAAAIAGPSVPVVLKVVELEQGVPPAEPIPRQARPIVIGERAVAAIAAAATAAGGRDWQMQPMRQPPADVLSRHQPADAGRLAQLEQMQRAFYEHQAAADAARLLRLSPQVAGTEIDQSGVEYFRFTGVTVQNGPNRNGDVYVGQPTEITAARRAGSNQLEIISRSPRDGEVAVARASGYTLEATEFTPAGAYVPGDPGLPAAAEHPAAGEAAG